MSSHHVYAPAKHKTCEGISCSMSLVIIMVAVSGLALFIDGFVIARPGLPALNFQETICTVQNRSYIDNRPCECAGLSNDNPYCESHFPCVKIIAEFDANNRSGDVHNTNSRTKAIVHEHESIAFSNHADCSILSCAAEMKGNTHKVNIFIQKYGIVGTTYTCFYNSHNPSIVILKKNYTREAIILSLAIPGGILGLSIFALIIMCVRRRSKKKPKSPQPPVQRTYMNPSYVPGNDESGSELQENRHQLPGCCESDTYTRLEDPSPPQARASESF